MHPDMSHSQSSLPSSLELLADVDILAKSVDSDFVPVSDVVLFKSFDVPSGMSLNDLSKGTLAHRMISDISSRPSDEWWLNAIGVIIKHCPDEADPAPCAAEIYLARVAQAHIDAGNTQLDYIEGRTPGMEFIDSKDDDNKMAFVAVTKQDATSAPAGLISEPATATAAEVTALIAAPDTSTTSGDLNQEDSFPVGGQITDSSGVALTDISELATGITGGEEESKDLDGALVREGRRGEEIQHDNVDAAAMGGLGLSGDEEIKGDSCGCEDESVEKLDVMAIRSEEEEAKQGLIDDIKLLQRKLDEADKWRKLLDKVQVYTGEQDAIKRLQSHVHSGDTDDSMEMKAGGT